MTDNRMNSSPVPRGLPTALVFYPESGSFLCTQELTTFRESVSGKPHFHPSKARVIAISPDTVEKQKWFVEQEHFNFPVLSDAEGTAAGAYDIGRGFFGLTALARVTFVVDKSGVIRDALDTTVNTAAHQKLARTAVHKGHNAKLSRTFSSTATHKMPIVTPVTKMLGIRVPVIQGGMQWVGVPALAAAVSEAGGLGILTALTQPSPDALRQAIRETKKLTSKPFGVNITLLPSINPPDYPGYARAAVEEGVKIFETAGNNPGPLIKYFKENNCIVIHKCTTIRHAKSAERHGVDIMSIDGFECTCGLTTYVGSG
ncbi:hypothetical protein NMY22_g13285 [Coprinellus aureogranulatus]|nr:hypothetical protein NMY22_g13285 [Coprinellus aureogranulatus]